MSLVRKSDGLLGLVSSNYIKCRSKHYFGKLCESEDTYRNEMRQTSPRHVSVGFTKLEKLSRGVEDPEAQTRQVPCLGDEVGAMRRSGMSGWS